MRRTLVAVLVFAGAVLAAAQTSPTYDVLITGGRVVDGTGAPWVRADVGIRADRIAAIGQLESAAARTRIDASGLVVSPGFIDMLGQSEFNVLVDNRAASKLMQGVTTELTGEDVLADGQKLQHTATADMDVQRPNRVRVLMKSARNERQLTYDGKTLSLNTPAEKFYGTLELEGTLGDVIDRLESQYGMQIPLDDLFRFGTPAAQFDKIESAMNAGQDFVDGDLCDHYAYRSGKVDWQLRASRRSCVRLELPNEQVFRPEYDGHDTNGIVNIASRTRGGHLGLYSD